MAFARRPEVDTWRRGQDEAQSSLAIIGMGNLTKVLKCLNSIVIGHSGHLYSYSLQHLFVCMFKIIFETN